MLTPRAMTVSAAYAFPQFYYRLLLLLALNQTIPLQATSAHKLHKAM